MTIIPILRSALLAAALISLVAGKIAHASDANTRAVREAKMLFLIVTTSILQSKSEACSVSSAWLDHPVPEKIAHSQFGLTVHADLAPPFQTVTPVNVLGLGNKGLFCNPKDAEAYRAERLLAFKSSNDKSLSIEIAAFNFPVFNSNYSKAVIIYLGVRHSWRKYDDGKPTGDLESVSIAFVYRKKNGHWRETLRHMLDIS